MTDRPESDAAPVDPHRPAGPGSASRPVDPAEHPTDVEEWRSEVVPPSDVDEEAVIDEAPPSAVPTDRGDSIVVPDDDRPVDLNDDDVLLGEDDTIEDRFVEEE